MMLWIFRGPVFLSRRQPASQIVFSIIFIMEISLVGSVCPYLFPSLWWIGTISYKLSFGRPRGGDKSPDDYPNNNAPLVCNGLISGLIKSFIKKKIIKINQKILKIVSTPLSLSSEPLQWLASSSPCPPHGPVRSESEWKQWTGRWGWIQSPTIPPAGNLFPGACTPIPACQLRHAFPPSEVAFKTWLGHRFNPPKSNKKTRQNIFVENLVH